MKHLIFLVLYINFFISLPLQGVFHAAVAHKENNKTIAVFANQNSDNSAEKSLNTLNEEHYQAFIFFLNKINRHYTKVAVLVNTTADHERKNPQSVLPLRLYKNFKSLRKSYKNITFSTPELLTSAISVPIQFMLYFSERYNRIRADDSTTTLPRNEKLKIELFLKSIMSQMSNTTAREYQKELEAIQSTIKEKYPDHYDEYLPIKDAASRFFYINGKSKELVKNILYNFFHKKSLSVFKKEAFTWMCDFEYFITQLTIKNSVKDNTITILCSHQINVYNIQEELNKCFNNPIIAIGQCIYSDDTNTNNPLDCKKNTQPIFNMSPCTTIGVKYFIEQLFSPFTCQNCHKQEELSERFQVCANCKKIHYCSKSCQISDWQSHKETCHKKSSRVRTCQTCQKTTTNKDFQRCSSCKKVQYCSRECQKVDWKTNHKKECSHLKG